MKKKRFLAFITGMLLVVPAGSLAGCSQEASESKESVESSAGASGHASECSVSLTEGKYSEEKLDDTWDVASAVQIQLENDTITSDGNKVKIEENKVTLTEAGIYVLSGQLKDGQVIVDAEKEDYVKIVLNGADISCSSSAPVYSKGGNVIITLADGTENSISDGEGYVYGEGETEEPSAAVFAKDDLTFNGTGTLTVNGNYNHAIQCKDALKFVDGTYMVSAVNDGIVGKDSISVKNGQYTIESGDDGIKVTNYEEQDKGYVLIENGIFRITAGGDGIQAETLLRINDGEFQIAAGGGSSAEELISEGEEQVGRRAESPDGFNGGGAGMPEGEKPTGEMPEGSMPEGEKPTGEMPERERPTGEMPEGEAAAMGQKMPEGEVPVPGKKKPAGEASDAEISDPEYEEETGGKALKSYVELVIAGGTFDLDAADDAVHSNQNITIADGELTVSTGDDGLHADHLLTIESGGIDILKSYEGLEGFEIIINGGDIKIYASDDGINAAGDSEGFMPEEDQGAVLTINDGTVYVNAQGDGLDANGDIFINGGKISVHGPSDGGNGTLDYASICKITGGTFVGIGSAGMAQNPSEDSIQPVIAGSFAGSVEEGTVVAVKDSEGRVILSAKTEKTAQWFALSSPELKEGKTYLVCAGGEEREVKTGEGISIVNFK